MRTTMILVMTGYMASSFRSILGLHCKAAVLLKKCTGLDAPAISPSPSYARAAGRMGSRIQVHICRLRVPLYRS